MKKINVENWRENSEALSRLNGSNHVLILHPPKMGKTKMNAIANALKSDIGALTIKSEN